MTVSMMTAQRKKSLFDTSGQEKRSQTAKINRAHGKQAEEIAMNALRKIGFKCVEKIETGFTVIRSGKKITGAFPVRKVAGDIRAIGHGGQAIYCECKFRENKLKWSDMEAHQMEAMEDITRAGGAAFLVWVACLNPERVYLLQWPFNVLRKGRAITENEAADLESSVYFGFVEGSKKGRS